MSKYMCSTLIHIQAVSKIIKAPLNCWTLKYILWSDTVENMLISDKKKQLKLLILCPYVRLCTMTPVGAELDSGTVSSASNTWRLEITWQLRFFFMLPAFKNQLTLIIIWCLLFKLSAPAFQFWVSTAEEDFRWCAVGGSVPIVMPTITRALLLNRLF